MAHHCNRVSRASVASRDAGGLLFVDSMEFPTHAVRDIRILEANHRICYSMMCAKKLHVGKISLAQSWKAKRHYLKHQVRLTDNLKQTLKINTNLNYDLGLKEDGSSVWLSWVQGAFG